MKAVVAAATDAGLAAPVSGHFGSAPFFVIGDPAAGTGTVVANPGSDHAHGQCRPLAGLPLDGVGAVLCAGLGVRALQLLNAQGIRVYRCGEVTVGEALRQFAVGELPELAALDACRAHRCG